MRGLIVTAALALLLAMPSPRAGLAAGDGNFGPSTGGGSQTVTQPKPPTCKKGYVYSQVRRRCVKVLSETIPDAELKAQGWALAYDGDYEAAIELFRVVSDPSDPEALNGLGYSHRKLGRIDEGIAYYRQAIAIDPDYVRAREYLGEGYVAAGKIDLAKAELVEIEKRCGVTCEEYVDLAEAIAKSGATSY